MLKKIGTPKSKLNIGLDIGNSSVKMVQILHEARSGTREITNFEIQPLKSSKRSDVVQAIKAIMERLQLTAKYINTSVSGQTVIVRYIQMPKMSKEELGKALKLSVGKYIPFNAEEINYDFQILENIKNTEKIRVLLVAAKKEIVQERIDILKEAGLSAQIIDIDSFAIVNSFQLLGQQNKGIIAVLDIGADITSTTILHNEVPYFSRDVPLGGNELNKAILEEFEITAAEAESLKQDPKGRYGDLLGAIKPVLDKLCTELRLSFNFCESQLGEVVNKVFITGGTAKFKGLDKVLNSILGLDVAIWDPTQMLKISENLPKARIIELGPLLSVSIGLALRG
ncbi:MAG: type IV pilus assembly protein PilM [Candidatus Omnitrophica bacterium]|nr:type IV pilus assembly protein PilM [Candidatus Omnitrophota bacterium]MBU1924721.1 type IV pilus assembly protein PilM [Candidatus Omnitrophota bacterium]MBU2062999.1 type IV pilus assembly protein PilM [Candidatus Omnitrophota bacterium]